MYNLQYDNDFLIPVIYDKNPYAYLIIDINNNIEYIEYYKNKKARKENVTIEPIEMTPTEELLN